MRRARHDERFYNDNQISGQTKKEANLRHVQWAPRDMPRVWVGATSLCVCMGEKLIPLLLLYPKCIIVSIKTLVYR